MNAQQKVKRPRVVISQRFPVQYVLDQHDQPFEVPKEPKQERPDIVGEAEARNKEQVRKKARAAEAAYASKPEEEHALDRSVYRNKAKAAAYLADLERKKKAARRAAARFLKTLKK